MLLLLVPGIQSGQHYHVCQNTILVNKWMAKYQHQLNDTRQYWAQLKRAKWVSMLGLKARFHSIQLKHASSYNLTFVTHLAKF